MESRVCFFFLRETWVAWLGLVGESISEAGDAWCFLCTFWFKFYGGKFDGATSSSPRLASKFFMISLADYSADDTSDESVDESASANDAASSCFIDFFLKLLAEFDCFFSFWWCFLACDFVWWRLVAFFFFVVVLVLLSSLASAGSSSLLLLLF